ncbi:MAG: PAS domain-containing protein, partial [Candidatus Eremiobacterota bacterium]
MSELPPFEPMSDFLVPEIVGVALRHTPAGISALDPHRRIVFCNPSTERILGRDHEQLIGSDYLTYVSPDDRDAFLHRIQDPSVPQRVAYPCRVLRPDGETRDVEMLHFHVELRGQPVVAVVVLDVTEGRRLVHKMTTLAHFVSSLAYAGSLEGTLSSLAEKVVQTTDAVSCA